MNSLDQNESQNRESMYCKGDASLLTLNKDFIKAQQSNQPFLFKGFLKKHNIMQWANLSRIQDLLASPYVEVTRYLDSFYNLDDILEETIKFEAYRKELEGNKKSKKLSHLCLELCQKKGDLSQKINQSVLKMGFEKGLRSRTLLIGRDTITNMHYHRNFDSCLYQIRGEKELVLFSPEQFYSLRPYSWYTNKSHFSSLLFNATSASQYIDIAKDYGLKKPQIIRVEPGDLLFIPIYWWHIVFGAGINVTLVDFFLATKTIRFMTWLGLRSLNHLKVFTT